MSLLRKGRSEESPNSLPKPERPPPPKLSSKVRLPLIVGLCDVRFALSGRVRTGDTLWANHSLLKPHGARGPIRMI